MSSTSCYIIQTWLLKHIHLGRQLGCYRIPEIYFLSMFILCNNIVSIYDQFIEGISHWSSLILRFSVRYNTLYQSL